MTARLRVEGAYPHQPMHPPLAGEVPVGVGARDPKRHRAQPGLLPVQAVDLNGIVSPPLEVSQVHPQKHLRPVAALCPPCSGVDREVTVPVVVRTGQQRLQLQAPQVGGELLRLGGDFPEGV